MRRFLPYLISMLLGCGITLLAQYSYAFATRSAPNVPAGGANTPASGAKLDLSVVSGGQYKVTRVIDGDTFVLENGLHVRCLGVNAPEVGRYVKDPAPMGLEATARTKELLEGQNVRLELGPTPLDTYGRLVARAFVHTESGDVDLEETLAREGLAKIMFVGPEGDTKYRDALKTAEGEARENKRGIWGVTSPVGTPAAADFHYWAASKGRVFHKPECATLKQISPANLQGYRTLEEALATGRSPCSHCCKNLETVKPE